MFAYFLDFCHKLIFILFQTFVRNRYHIYSAAVLAHFDSKWGMEYFDRVNMLVRDIANPSADDTFFPVCRQKDWYQGSSWASGIIPYLNG